MARDKTTSEIGSKKIANLINETLKKKIMDSKGKIISVSFKTICRYLNELLGTPEKSEKVFFYQKNKGKRESNFAKIFYQGDYHLKTLCSRMKPKLI